MRNRFVNICHNPRFSLWPWGVTGFTGVAGPNNFGKTAARWFFQTTSGGGDTATVLQGTNSSTTKYDKWLRSAPNMTITVSARATNNQMRVRQFLEGGSVFGQSIVAMTVIASGPLGATFYYGAGDNYGKLTTLGDDVNGDPILVTATEFFPFDDPQYEYLRITPFESPSANGTFRLHFVQAEVLLDPTKISDFEVRPDWFEWDIISRYVTPVTQGMAGVGSSTSAIRVPVAAPLGGWKQTPAIPTAGSKTSVNIVLNTGTTTINAASPTFQVSTTPAANTLGCVIVLGGFTGLTVGSPYVIGAETIPICYLDADYF